MNRALRAAADQALRPRLPAAVLWDMDGTLVDTEPYWFAAQHDVVEQYGTRPWTDEHHRALIGSDLLAAGEYMRLHGGIDLEPVEIVERLLDGVVARLHRRIPWRPGARELLGELVDAGVPCALVTMSWRRFVQPILAQLPAGTFAAIVTGDEVPPGEGKPHPTPYRLGATGCGADPADCVAIEDSPTGVRSALAAGCSVVGVPNVIDIEPASGLTIVDSLEELDVDRLAEVSAVRAHATPRRDEPGDDDRHRRPVWLLVALALVTLAVVAIAASRDGGGTASDATAPPGAAAAELDPWLTFPEGLTIEQMVERLRVHRPDLDADAFRAAIDAAPVPAPYVLPDGVTSREGLVFPNTYRVDGPGDERALVDQMIGLTAHVAADEGVADGAATLGLTPYELLVVASMIEKEAGVDADRPLIARVILNRIERGMPLQIDATLYYGNSTDAPFVELRETDSPYNTYLRDGLPPTPIANPGQASIRAAVAPADDLAVDDPLCADLPETDCAYLFYVRAAADGSHAFAATYEQHLANVEAAREAGVL